MASPSVLASLSEQGIEDSEMGKAMAQLLGGGAQGRRTRLVVAHDRGHARQDRRRPISCATPGSTPKRSGGSAPSTGMPLDYAALADEIGDGRDGYIAAANGSIDLSGTRRLATDLAAKIRATNLSAADPARANRLLMDLGRLLVPVNFTEHGPFEQDLALGTQPVPGLREVAQLGTLDAESDDFRFLRTRLVRQQNRIEHAMRAALRLVTEFSA